MLSPHDDTEELHIQLMKRTPFEILTWVHETFDPGEVTMATGFGAEGVCLIDMLTKINNRIPILYLDTDVLFQETYQLRIKLQDRYGIRFVRIASSLSLDRQAVQYGDRLWERDPDLCCTLRKTDPLKEALRPFDAWITGIRRDQSSARKNAKVIERDGRYGLLKVNPLLGWSREEVWSYIREHRLPYNPLYDKGYSSIGCIHCTTPVSAGEDERAGRWRGFQKTECGLHNRTLPSR
ncbi:MAG: phosphoadenylyl-sulfate reductase [Ignavibacteriales bacterium]|nr:phosphoadenylyl-sulfate reductase [Ignavibacteriales bacterium]